METQNLSIVNIKASKLFKSPTPRPRSNQTLRESKKGPRTHPKFVNAFIHLRFLPVYRSYSWSRFPTYQSSFLTFLLRTNSQS